ncbi:MAG: high frequency lysogenization protein HflD [Gammaproteobacteria bacterium]|nr:high frequency lysogenization protein HflD [Gammaproteobacteria bacterium]
MKFTDRDRTLALAGVFQGASLAQRLARHGMADQAELDASVASVFVFDADSTETVFGGLSRVASGLRLVKDKLTEHSGPNDPELTRYVLSLVQVARRLMRDPGLMERLRTGVAEISPGDGADDDLVSRLAILYTQTVSKLNPRILVNGEPHHLKNPQITNRIRAALLAGVRAGVLFWQVGGQRWHLVLHRRQFVAMAERLLSA